ncbi:MAG TPA: hypothetical protein VMG38_00240 [Trebonia sp.]|nr:hypothetical protein [Trebonia sp.]
MLRALAWVLTVLVTGLVGGIPQAGAATLATAVWSASSTVTGATGASYTYSFTAATSASLSSVTMTVPAGTGGTPAVGTVSPGSLAGGTVSLVGSTLTYSFAATQVGLGTAVSIQVSGLTNTSTAGTYTSQVTTRNGASAVDTGPTGPFAFTGTALTSPTLTASSSTVGAASASYTYAFTTTSPGLITSVTMTVPPGTGGSPIVGTVSPPGLAGGTVTLSGTTLTYSSISLTLPPGTAVSIEIDGLINTATAGHYDSEVVTSSTGTVVDAGTSALSITGPLTLFTPDSLSWAGTLNGNDQSIPDTTAADQGLTVSDQTATADGWHVTVAATTFTSGAHTLPDAGTLVVTGSLSAVTATMGSTAACDTSCVPPDNTVGYPVAITTASASPVPSSIYDAQANSGLGVTTLGGASSADPVGWWLNVPADAAAGSYSSTVTVSIVSGP